MQKIHLYVMYDEKGRMILTNANNDIYVSSDRELMEFIADS